MALGIFDGRRSSRSVLFYSVLVRRAPRCLKDVERGWGFFVRSGRSSSQVRRAAAAVAAVVVVQAGGDVR